MEAVTTTPCARPGFLGSPGSGGTAPPGVTGATPGVALGLALRPGEAASVAVTPLPTLPQVSEDRGEASLGPRLAGGTSAWEASARRLGRSSRCAACTPDKQRGKHHFHRICISRLDMPECPSCSSGLPFSWCAPGKKAAADADR